MPSNVRFRSIRISVIRAAPRFHPAKTIKREANAASASPIPGIQPIRASNPKRIPVPGISNRSSNQVAITLRYSSEVRSGTPVVRDNGGRISPRTYVGLAIGRWLDDEERFQVAHLTGQLGRLSVCCGREQSSASAGCSISRDRTHNPGIGPPLGGLRQNRKRRAASPIRHGTGIGAATSSLN